MAREKRKSKNGQQQSKVPSDHPSDAISKVSGMARALIKRSPPSFNCTVCGWIDGAETTMTLTCLDRWTSQSASNVTLDFNGKLSIRIFQNPHSPHLGGYIWDTAALLCLYLQAHVELGHLSLHDKNILELGSGVTAIPSILCGKLGARRIIATDIPDLVDDLSKNIHLNGLKNDVAEARQLSWGDTVATQAIVADLRPDVVLASDCIYSEASAKALVQTMYEICSSMFLSWGVHVSVYCISEIRNVAAQEEFQKEAAQVFDYEIIPGPDDDVDLGKEGWWRWVPEAYRVDHVNFYKMSLKTPLPRHQIS